MPKRIRVDDVMSSADKLYEQMVRQTEPHHPRLYLDGGVRVESRQAKAIVIALVTAFNEALDGRLGEPGE